MEPRLKQISSCTYSPSGTAEKTHQPERLFLIISQYRSRAKLKELAVQGDAESQNSLGDCHMQGIGVELDLREAMKWYTKAAAQGLADAQVKVGILRVFDGQSNEMKNM